MPLVGDDLVTLVGADGIAVEPLADGTCPECDCAPTTPPHRWFLYCPCNYPGCWPDHPTYYIRDDAICALPGGGGDTIGHQAPQLIKIFGAGGDWCYKVHGSISDRTLIPPGRPIIEPGGANVAQIDCLPAGSNCDDAPCTHGTGPCPCGCERACAICRSPDPNATPPDPGLFCCYGSVPPAGSGTQSAVFDWEVSGTLVTVVDNSVLNGGPGGTGQCYNVVPGDLPPHTEVHVTLRTGAIIDPRPFSCAGPIKEVFYDYSNGQPSDRFEVDYNLARGLGFCPRFDFRDCGVNNIVNQFGCPSGTFLECSQLSDDCQFNGIVVLHAISFTPSFENRPSGTTCICLQRQEVTCQINWRVIPGDQTCCIRCSQQCSGGGPSLSGGKCDDVPDMRPTDPGDTRPTLPGDPGGPGSGAIMIPGGCGGCGKGGGAAANDAAPLW